MKRIKSVFTIGLAILALMVMGIPAFSAQAAADITVSVTASPAEMTGAGSTNVTVTVGANVGVENIALAGPGISSLSTWATWTRGRAPTTPLPSASPPRNWALL